MTQEFIITILLFLALIVVLFDISKYLKDYGRYANLPALGPAILVLIVYTFNYKAEYVINLILAAISGFFLTYTFFISRRYIYSLALSILISGPILLYLGFGHYAEYAITTSILLFCIGLIKDTLYEKLLKV